MSPDCIHCVLKMSFANHVVAWDFAVALANWDVVGTAVAKMPGVEQ
jgi:hypothetical protein